MILYLEETIGYVGPESTIEDDDAADGEYGFD